ncbi:ribonuclease R [Metamycoplasma phocicerebrale]|uniref:Ribonuclease R n=1 Tax=Metamycoplasma phocicerebrale TaxID=142649 RepID=A0A3T0TTX8_9BACT|nr:ribonuclease R [Metamycoplasma phocicerebrale]AZZ65510.1 ribonuclease R [Metamycoplasma phocicerebrale]
MKFENKKNLDPTVILKLIQNNNLGLNFLQIAKKLQIHPSQNNKLTFLLKKMVDENEIDIDKNNNYFPIYFIKNIETQISITNKRLGFIDFDEDNNLEHKKSAILFPFQLKNILDGDLVLAKVFYYFNEENQKLYKAKLLKLLKHNMCTIVGIWKKSDKFKYYFEPLNEKDSARFDILNKWQIPKDIKENQIIKVKILEPNEQAVIGKYEGILTSKDDFEYPFKKIFAENEVNLDFNEETHEAALNLPDSVSQNEIKSRKDLRNLLTVTIDGLDTKDFDDAISCFDLDNGNKKLFIHIADVSYYVKEGSPIDKEALIRGTSIYLPDKVIPMLPFELSNGICSLNPNVDRNTLTLELEIDSLGKNVDFKLYESVINSNYRLTYNEVNDFYESKIKLPKEIENMLNVSKHLSKILRQSKLNDGYVNFDIKEPKIIMKDGKVIDIVIREEGESENMIEDFMVRANETVALIMLKKNIPSIYRIHDKPSSDKLFELQQLINFSGIKNVEVPYDGEPLSFAKMVNELKEKSYGEYMKNAFLRTMQKAIYSSDNIGHFGLASKQYSHFTSPIRRYPDLLLHRLIRKYLFNHDNKEYTNEELLNLKSRISEIASQNSESEKTAMSIERDIVDIRKAEFFDSLIGKEFNATLISIEKFGAFFNINKYQTSVLIRFENLEDNIIKVSNYEVKGQKYNLRVGNDYKIKITSIEREKGNINAQLC